MLETFRFSREDKKFILPPWGINLVEISSIVLNTSKNTGWQKIQIDFEMPVIEVKEKFCYEINVPSMHLIIDINAEKLIGSKGVPIGVEKIALFSWKCFGIKLKRTADPYNGLLEQVKEYEHKSVLLFIKHKLVLSKKNGLAEYNDNGTPLIRTEAEIADFASVNDEEFKKTDNGLPYIIDLTPQDKLLIQKSAKWKK